MTAHEQVGLYDANGVEVDVVPRSRMRAENLRHGATSVIVRDGLGRIYVHRRTTTKDVYPGLLDFAAGGVLQGGELPDDGAAREAEEELGVHGVPLRPMGNLDYADTRSRYRAFRYVVTYDGPIHWQAEEVSAGAWFTVDSLVRLIDERPEELVPDSPALWREQLHRWAADRVVLPGGWDSHTSLVEDRWVDRSPQRDEVLPWLLAETRLLPLIAPLLPLEVPVPVVVESDPVVARHRLVVGDPCEPASLTADDAAVTAHFLRVLHDLPDSLVVSAAVRSSSDDGRDRAQRVASFRAVVLPLLPPSQVAVAERLLQGVGAVGEQALCHGDLTGEHLLRRGGRVAGVIDWGDARITDPALDLAWVLCGTSEHVARTVVAAYGATPTQMARAAAWFALSPWPGVTRAVLARDAAARHRGLRQLITSLDRWDRHL